MNQSTQKDNRANMVTTLEQAIQIANPTDDMQKRSSNWMPYQRDILLKAEAAARFALDQLEQVKKAAFDLQQKYRVQERELLTAKHELDNLQLRDQLSQYQTQKTQKDQNKKKPLSGSPLPPGWRTTLAMKALAKRCQTDGNSETTPDTHAPFDIRKAIAEQNTREDVEQNTREDVEQNTRDDVELDSLPSPILNRQGEERDLLGRFRDPSLLGGDCFC